MASTQNEPEPKARTGRKRGPMTEKQRALAQARFLAAYREHGNKTAACEAARIDRTTMYDWLEKDEPFALAVGQAEEIANDRIRGEIRRRAIDGVVEPVVNNGRLAHDDDGHVLTVRKFSDTLLIFLAKSRMPEFRERQQVDVHATLDINGLAAEADAKFAAFLAASGVAGVLGEPDAGTEG